jgi:hypothetical protein
MNNSLRGKFWLSIFVLILALPMTSMSWLAIARQSATEDLWFNVESTPLEVRISPNGRHLHLLNRSPGLITRYRLGCVRQRPEMRVVRTLPVVKADLEAGKVLINSLSLYADNVERCSRDTGRLAVVEVNFRDGSVWKIR